MCVHILPFLVVASQLYTHPQKEKATTTRGKTRQQYSILDRMRPESTSMTSISARLKWCTPYPFIGGSSSYPSCSNDNNNNTMCVHILPFLVVASQLCTHPQKEKATTTRGNTRPQYSILDRMRPESTSMTSTVEAVPGPNGVPHIHS